LLAAWAHYPGEVFCEPYEEWALFSPSLFGFFQVRWRNEVSRLTVVCDPGHMGSKRNINARRNQRLSRKKHEHAPVKTKWSYYEPVIKNFRNVL
jgi:hypothetical protein